MTACDTLIIGAGAAGIAAAVELVKAGREVLLLEARDRIGGRVHTVHQGSWPLPLELGAEFIHGRPAETWDVAHAHQLRTFDFTDSHWGSQGGQPVKENPDWPGVEQIMRRLDRVGHADCTFDQFLQQHAADQPPGARALAKAFVEGLDAADASVVSARSIYNSEVDGETFDADTPFRLLDGYDGLLGALKQTLPAEAFVLNCVVQSIEWGPGRVTLRTIDGRHFSAARAVITLPIGVLRASPGEPGAVRFEPPLPPEMCGAIGLMRMGPVVKVMLRFHRPFWESGPWADLGFLHAPGRAFPTWWTMLPMRVPLLTAWAGGPAAEALSHLPAAEVLTTALETLGSLLGVCDKQLRSELVESHIADWQADPFSRGAYAFAAVGGSEAVRTLATPVQNTLFFAGEATHPGYAGTVAAAIASGRRAAGQLLG